MPAAAWPTNPPDKRHRLEIRTMHLTIRRAMTKLRLPRWLPFAPVPDFVAMRRHERYSCCSVATLLIVDRGVELEGLVLEGSIGGLLFREASTFVFDRSGAAVRVHVAGLSLAGTIVNVRSRGYGIRLNHALNQEELDRILAPSGGPTPSLH
jgi:hypothetical protein